MWDSINRSNPPIEFSGAPAGIILPHHTITAVETARFYKGLAQKIQPATVIIISPNHFETGNAPIITCGGCRYKTVYGILDVDESFTQKLYAEKIAVKSDTAFTNEHGVFFHAPFIKKYFPHAKIVPILLMWNNTREVNDRLATFLQKNTDKDCLILASVDFSHYQPKAIADFHDERSYFAIKNFRLYDIPHIEVDSPSSIYVILKTMNLLGNKYVVRYNHTNSDDFLKETQVSTTSHQYFAFYHSAPAYEQGITVFVPGTIGVPNDSLFIRTFWDWNRNKKTETSIETHLANIRGDEDRFLSGADLYLFDLPSFDVPEFYSAANESIAVIKFSDDIQKIKSQTETIIKLKKDHSFVFILFQYGSPKAKNGYRTLFRSWIDNGADLIVGKGITEIQKEIYHGKPILYSLGDFITENTTSNGECEGIVFSKDPVRIYSVPIRVENGLPDIIRSNYSADPK